MEIRNMRRAKAEPEWNWDTKAFFSVKTKNFTLHNCRLILAPSGKLVPQFPRERHMEIGRMVEGPVIEFDDLDYLEAVREAAVKVYEVLAAKGKYP